MSSFAARPVGLLPQLIVLAKARPSTSPSPPRIVLAFRVSMCVLMSGSAMDMDATNSEKRRAPAHWQKLPMPRPPGAPIPIPATSSAR